MRSGCSSIVKMLEEATDKKAFNLGKPIPLMLRGARKMLGLRASFTVMIGDHMDTDILGGVQLGYHTVLLMTGRAQQEELQEYSFQPDTIVKNLSELSVDQLEVIINQKPIDEDYLITFDKS